MVNLQVSLISIPNAGNRNSKFKIENKRFLGGIFLLLIRNDEKYVLNAVYWLFSPQIYFSRDEIKAELEDFHIRLAASKLPSDITSISLLDERQYYGI